MIKITNDTSTLDGSLLNMKDQLITELANQGVTASYDSSTGLLGLIHKISEITPVTQTLTLTSNKSILSQADSETATLTVTHSRGAGKTVEIYDAVDGTKIGDATDNGDGTYTYTYSSSGVGDISMTATSGTLESNAITIEDCIIYHPSEISRTSTHTSDSLIPLIENFTFTSDNFIFEADVTYGGTGVGLGVAPSGRTTPYHHMCFAYSDQQGGKLSFYVGSQNSGETPYRYDSINLNTYYNHKIEFSNSTINTYVNNTLKGAYSNLSYLNGETRGLYWIEWETNKTITAKNIKLKKI